MPNRSSKDPDDIKVLAAQIVDKATWEPESPKPKKKNPAAVALGKLGGKKGGPARAARLTPERRSEIASEAARRRWEKERSRE